MGGLAALAAAAVVLTAVASSPTGPGAPSATPGVPAAMSAAPSPPVSFAAVGDSITKANSVDLTGFRVGDRSWVRYAAGSGLRFAGGWANGGAETATMVRNVLPVHADVLVIVAGTNDTAHGVPFSTTARNLLTIARKVGIERVVVSAIPPRNATPTVSVEFNRNLELFVTAQGWTFVDAMAGVREGDQYADGMTRDGTHPTRRGAAVIGAAIAKAIKG